MGPPTRDGEYDQAPPRDTNFQSTLEHAAVSAVPILFQSTLEHTAVVSAVPYFQSTLERTAVASAVPYGFGAGPYFQPKILRVT